MAEFTNFQLSGDEGLGDIARILVKVSSVQNDSARQQTEIKDAIGDVAAAAHQLRSVLGSAIEIVDGVVKGWERTQIQEKADSSATDAVDTTFALMKICNYLGDSESSDEAVRYALDFRVKAENVAERIGSLKDQLEGMRRQLNAFVNDPVSDLEKYTDHMSRVASDTRSDGLNASLITEEKARGIQQRLDDQS
jgi:hypothetical protein